MNTLLLGLSLTIAAPALKDPPKKTDTIVGEWEVESLTMGGQPSTTTGLKYTFTADGQWLIHRDGQVIGVAANRGFTMDNKTTPPSVDLISNTKAANMLRLQGIFKVEKDTLTICGTRQQGAERPTKFESPEGSQIVIYVLKRVKPE
jgi:uncharacterized protein (TIGR03067 family)